MILLRLAAGISLAMLWHLTTRWHDLLRTLRSLGVPQMFVMTAALTYRYLFVMAETLSEMVEARKSREVGACDKRQARAYAGAGSAILFAKSLAFPEEMHWAMLSRNSDGETAKARTSRWTVLDMATALAGVATLALVLFQRNHHVV
jgi:energy-coupling factor transporter transmembrane protein EcfT